MRSSRLAAGVITGLLISVVPAHAQMAKRPMTFADIMELKNVALWRSHPTDPRSPTR